MKDIDMRDEAQLMRVSTRLMELGILTPQQGMEMFHNGRFPEADKISPAQQDFVEERKAGYYNPLVGGVPMIEPEIGGATKTPNQAGRPEGTTGIPIVNAKYSRADIQKTIYEIDEFINEAKGQMLENIESDKLSESQEEMVANLCESIVCSQSKESWSETMESCVKDFNEIENLHTLTQVLEISNDHKLDLYPAAILYHSKENS